MKDLQTKPIQYFNTLELPTLDEIKTFANHALMYCPTKIQKTLINTSISVENFVSKEILKELNLSDKKELLGLYKVYDNSKKRELILYRCPLIMYSLNSNEDILSVVSRVTVYEISHRSNCSYLRKQWLDKIKKSTN